MNEPDSLLSRLLETPTDAVGRVRQALRDYAGIGFIILFAVWMLAA